MIWQKSWQKTLVWKSSPDSAGGGGNIVAAAREQWNDGSNTLTIAPGVVVVYDRNTVTNKILEEYGLRLIKIRGSELVRGRGGPRCMSMPFEREEI